MEAVDQFWWSFQNMATLASMVQKISNFMSDSWWSWPGNGHDAGLRTNHPWPRYPSHHRRACRSPQKRMYMGWSAGRLVNQLLLIFFCSAVHFRSSATIPVWSRLVWLPLADGAKPMLRVAVFTFWTADTIQPQAKDLPKKTKQLCLVGTTRLQDMHVSHAN